MNIDRKILFLSGAIASDLYIATDILASWWYGGYRIADQNYSELLATGAPTRPFLIVVSIVYNLLVALFALGIWRSAEPKRTAHATGIMMVTYAAVGLVTGLVFQMDLRGAAPTPFGSLHPHMTALMSLFILLSIGYGAFLLGRWFRIYSFITLAVLIVFGYLTSQQVPQLAAGLETPWMGLTERINIYATMLWFEVLSIALFFAAQMQPAVLVEK